MASIVRGQIIRDDVALFDGVTRTSSRTDATGGTVTGLNFGDAIDILQVFGGGTSRSVATINNAIGRLGGASGAFQFTTGTWTITSNLTIPSTIASYVPAGCVFEISVGVTLTIAGPLYADVSGFTSGSGTLVLSSDAIVAGQAWLKRTSAESSAGVTPTNYQYEPGTVNRYGTNTTPGTTDMTLALRSAISVVSASGGGIVQFLPETYLISTTGTHSTVVPVAGANYADSAESSVYHILLDGLSNIEFALNGATISCDETTGVSLFLLDSCRNIKFYGGTIQGVHAHDASGNITTPSVNAFAITSQDRNSYNLSFTNLDLQSLYTAVYVYGTQTRTYSVYGVTLDCVNHTNGVYTLACHMNGDNVTARGVHSSNVFREYFIYGVDNHDVQMSSDTAIVGFGSLIKAYHTRNTRNIKFKLSTSKGSSYANVALASEHHVATQAAPSKLQGIDVEVNNVGTSNGVPVAFLYHQSGVLTPTSSNQIFNGIVLRGVFEQGPEIDVTQNGAAGAWGSLNIDDAVLLNGTMDAMFDDKGFFDTKQQRVTFTPTIKINGSATGITYSAQAGEYWRDGRFLEMLIDFTLSSKGASTGGVTVDLPVTSSGINAVSAVSIDVLGMSNLASLTGIIGYVETGGDNLVLQQQAATAVASLTDANLTNTSRLILHVRYPIA